MAAPKPPLTHKVAKIMGIGPVPAVKKILSRNKMKLNEIDLIELNEAFAAQVLACDRELKFDANRLNVNGGAIAMGCTKMVFYVLFPILSWGKQQKILWINLKYLEKNKMNML